LLFEAPSAAASTAPLAWQAVGQIGGPTQAVAVHGSYAYVGVGMRLVVLDVSNPSDLREVGGTPPFPHLVEDIAISGTLAYVAAGGAGLRVVDVSNPALPIEIGAWDSRGYAQGVAVAGAIAYLADGPYGLRVVDVSKPSQPVEVGSAYPMNYAFDVAVQGHYAYIAGAGAGLLIVDVTDPRHPVEVGSLVTTGYAYGVAVAGSTVYVADGWDGVKVVNAADPAHPTQVSAFKTPGWAFGVTVLGTTAYVADAFGGLRVLNVADATHPVEVASSKMQGGHAGSVAVAGNTAYVADRNWGVRAVNLSAGPGLSQVGAYWPIPYAQAVAVSGHYAYVAAAGAGLRIVDIADPARPREVAGVDVAGDTKCVVARGSLIYLGSVTPDYGGGMLRIVDVADPARPVVTGSAELMQSTDLDVAGAVAYSTTEWGLDLTSVADLAHPFRLTHLLMRPSITGAGTTVGVAVDGAVAYVASSWAGLKTVDVSNPREPRVLATLATSPSYAQDVAVAGGKAYIAGAHRLVIADVSDAAHPSTLGSVDLQGAQGVTLAAGLVYVAAGANGMYVVDASDPSRHVVVGTFATQGFVHAVAVAADRVYAADGPNGLLILEKAGSAPNVSVGTPLVTERAVHGSPRRTTTASSPAPTVDAPRQEAPLPRFSAAEGSGGSCVVMSAADTGAGTLRQCLQAALGGDTITFDPSVFPPAHPAIIAPNSPLPALDRGGITVDASRAGVILDGSKSTGTGFWVNSDNNAIKGLQITRFPFNGVGIGVGARNNQIGGDRSRGSGPTGEGNVISLNGRFGVSIEAVGADGNIVSGNLIGTDRSGTAAAGNISGIVVHDGARNRIGGTTPGERNVISGSLGEGVSLGRQASKNIVIGNFIGTDVSGTKAIPNGQQGVFVMDGPANNRIGGTDPGERNVISGNASNGVTLQGSTTTENQVLGNYVGIDVTGTTALGNGGHGISMEGGAFNNLVQGNVSSGNGRGGIHINDLGASYNAILGNWVGTDATGTRALPNHEGGIGVAFLTSPFNRIGGTRPEERNLVSGNEGGGISVNSGGNLIRGNFVGTDITGRNPIRNGSSGVGLAGGRNMLGGTRLEEANVIAASGHIGVASISDHNYIAGNFIGTDLGGEVAMGNLVFGANVTGNRTTLQGNVIAHTVMAPEGGGGDGIHIWPPGTSTIRRNSIYDNASKGIEATVEPPAPIITNAAATGVTGRACAGCDVEIFSDLEDEGRVFEGSVVADGSGAFGFTKASGYLTGPNLTATATGRDGSTSGFSAPVRVPLAITTTSPLPAGTIGVPYSLQLASTGDPRSVTWSVASGSLPGGMTVSASGMFSGTPAAVGSYAFTVKVSNSAGESAQGAFTLIIAACTAPVIASQPQGACVQAGQAVALSVTAIGSSPLVYQWYRGVGGDTSNPVGLNAPAFTTPSLNGTTSYWVRVNNFCGQADSVTATLIALPATPVVSTLSTVGAGTRNLPASVPSRSGSRYQWAIQNGTITSGHGTSQITYTAGIVGTLTLSVVEVNSSGCSSFQGKVNVSVVNQPLVLSHGRVGVSVDWRNPYSGETGTAYALWQGDEFGFFCYSDPNNPEVFVKVLDFGSGTALCFVGGLTDFYYKVTFTTVRTGQPLVFEKPAYQYIGFVDAATLKFAGAPVAPAEFLTSGSGMTFVGALSTGQTSSYLQKTPAEALQALATAPQSLALSSGRVSVTVDWRNPYSGETGRAYGIPKADPFGFFYYTDASNPEVFVKVLDFGDGIARVFVGGLTDFYYKVTFTVLRTGQPLVFEKPEKQYIGFVDATTLRF
jgi:hypothetical protein